MKLSFNGAARENVLNGQTKIRIAMRDGVLRLRPTARKAGVNLPKGEKLIELKGSNAVLPEGFEAPQGKFALALDRYGWHAARADGAGRGDPVVTIG